MGILLSGAICLVGVVPVLAQGLQVQYESLEEYEEATGRKIEKFNEAPILESMVVAGSLPSVEERLPEEPQILEPREEIGQYGGTVRTFHWWPYPSSSLTVGNALFRIGTDASTIVPNIAKGWEYSEDGKTLTIYLRKGMKWSDGELFTVDDILFWFEDIYQNEELVPSIPDEWSPGGELMQLEKIDDYTVRWKFAASYPAAITYLAHYQGAQAPQWRSPYGVFAPKHYLEQFHIKYNPEADELAKEEGFDHWYELFLDRSDAANGLVFNPGTPALSAWVVTKKEPGYLVCERNPYYWKIDTEGNQLPYINRHLAGMVESPEIIEAKIITGEVDFADSYAGAKLESYPIYKEYEKEGGYKVLRYLNTYASDLAVQPNQTSKDPVLRKIFQDVRFRRALSLAIDREEISEVLFFGIAEPRQASVLDSSMYFEPGSSTAYIEYDPERANQLLNEMGLEWDKDHEYRLRPDGERLEVLFEYFPEICAGVTSILEMVKEHWKEIGFSVTLKSEEVGLYVTRAEANEIDMGAYTSSQATDIMFLSWPFTFFPVKVNQAAVWSSEWARWYETNGEKGEEPPAHMKGLQEVYEEMRTTTDKDKMIELGKEACRAQAENLWTIGTLRLPIVLIVKDNLQNFPEEGIWGWDTWYIDGYYPEQFFFKQN